MARTKASVGAKVSAGKSNKARCSVAPASTPSNSGASSKSSRNYSGGNPVCPRETPKWQKPITNFYVSTPGAGRSADDQEAGPSSKPHKRNVIHSDDEDEQDPEELPKNRELDESITLEPLDGESCHKIEEYYTSKGKGEGKKSNKENIDVNGRERSRGKRDLEDSCETDEQASKRLKIS